MTRPQVPAALAHHWYAALDLPLALPASVTAARQAMASYAPAEAQQHLERALQIWPRTGHAEQRTGLDQAEVSRLTADAAYAGAVDRAMAGAGVLCYALTLLRPGRALAGRAPAGPQIAEMAATAG